MLAKHSEVDKTVFVGNLHSSVKEEILFELFLQAGPLKKVTIARDREGRQRSYGFVCYKHQEAVPYAIALLNGIRLYGRPIRLQYSSGSSHSDGGTGPSDPPLEPHSANPVFPESPVFHFSAFPDNRGLSQDPMNWNTMVRGQVSGPWEWVDFPRAVPSEYFSTPASVLPPAHGLLPLSTSSTLAHSGFPPLDSATSTATVPESPEPQLQPPGAAPQPSPGTEMQGGDHTDAAVPSRLRKRRKNRERRRKSEKHRSREKAGGHVRARSHTRSGKKKPPFEPQPELKFCMESLSTQGSHRN